MVAISNKRSVMTLYSDPADAYSHQVRIVLAEKDLIADIINVDQENKPKELYEFNSYGSLPTLVDRDLVLYDSRIIMEYLDERFPHPPLMPVYPVARALSRCMILRIESEWYSLARDIQIGSEAQSQLARKKLQESLIALEPIFANKTFFNSEEFSLVDCWIAPLLWRLTALGIELPRQTTAISNYIARIFKRSSFQSSLSDVERELREQYDFN
ncbi:stringent starvation protein SspA [soil metagenome]